MSTVERPRWLLDDALEFVHAHQDWAFWEGYYLAIAGGCINKGGGKDLDLVAMPRWETVQRPNCFVQGFNKRLKGVPIIREVPTGLHLTYEHLAVEVSLVTLCPCESSRASSSMSRAAATALPRWLSWLPIFGGTRTVS